MICTLTAASLAASGSAFAFCSKPITPYCAEDGSLSDSYVPEDRCRRAVEDHVQDLTSYRSCLTAEVEQIDQATTRFRDLMGGGAENSRSMPQVPPAAGVATTPGVAGGRHPPAERPRHDPPTAQ